MSRYLWMIIQTLILAVPAYSYFSDPASNTDPKTLLGVLLICWGIAYGVTEGITRLWDWARYSSWALVISIIALQAVAVVATTYLLLGSSNKHSGSSGVFLLVALCLLASAIVTPAMIHIARWVGSQLRLLKKRVDQRRALRIGADTRTSKKLVSK